LLVCDLNDRIDFKLTIDLSHLTLGSKKLGDDACSEIGYIDQKIEKISIYHWMLFLYDWVEIIDYKRLNPRMNDEKRKVDGRRREKK
jgi:hypothetical protein